MAQENGNSSMEMGTSDQILVATKKSKKTTYAIGFVAMLVAIGVVITLVVVLSGNEGAESEPILTTEGPTFPTTIPTTTTSTTTTTTTTTTEAPTTQPPLPEIELEDIINGEYSSPSFNGTWTSGNEILFRNSNNDLVLYDVDTDSRTILIRNESQILQQSFRVTSLSADGNYVVLSYNEVSPGTKNPSVMVTIRNIATNTDTKLNAPSDLEEPILKTVSFVGNDELAVMWTNRVQTALRIDLCTEATQLIPATCNAIYRYTEDDGWIDNIPLLFNTQGNAFITILPAEVGGVRYKQIVQVTKLSTSGLWSSSNRINTAHTVAEILLWTDDNVIWYKATGITDRAEQHIYTVTSDGQVSCFTCNIKRPDGKQCLYNDAVISTGSRITVNCAGPEIPQIYIYDKNGTLLTVWDDNSRVADLLALHTIPVTLHQTVTGIGQTEADVMIQVPSDYASRTNVPLLVYVYGGPDTALVTKQWTLDWGTSLVNRYGIAVARIDGRGSGLQGVETMFAVNRKLGTVEIEDQISVTRYLQQNLSWVDGNRTCIWGWSYGGYASSLALARGGDVFRCAIAVAPVVDWRYYDTIYTERYMDTPQNNVQGYLNSSLLTDEVVEAYRNKRYFLVHGTEDDNVHYQHAMLISRLLQRRDVYFHQMSYTDEDHGLGGVRPHLYHALEKFLKENMF
ncbi:jg26500 [Pararge aegeria aegeria]|uniref:Venom dipeptidyl peptidase 4 n=1 Tax=Pararge aegeria aegeria TaxID=348720 RepID=A0A8S4S0B1_9NEOP|nr:jg26500 [Pararge aegeria aegeria]